MSDISVRSTFCTHSGGGQQSVFCLDAEKNELAPEKSNPVIWNEFKEISKRLHQKKAASKKIFYGISLTYSCTRLHERFYSSCRHNCLYLRFYFFFVARRYKILKI